MQVSLIMKTSDLSAIGGPVNHEREWNSKLKEVVWYYHGPSTVACIIFKADLQAMMASECGDGEQYNLFEVAQKVSWSEDWLLY
jgi:hypothetical protein